MESRKRILKRLELSLNTIRFNDIALGALVGHYLYLELLNKTKKQWYYPLLVVAKYLKNRYLSFDNRNYNPPEINKRLVHLSSNSPRFLKMVMPFINRLSPNEFTLLHREPLHKSDIGRKSLSELNYRVIPNPSKNEWKPQYKMIEGDLKSFLKEFIRDNKLPFWYYYAILKEIIFFTKKTINIEKLFQYNKPESIIVETDRNQWCATLVLVANKLKMKTFTMVHGATTNDLYGYLPLNAHFVMVWGNKHFEQFNKAGVKKERIIITGYHRLNPTIPHGVSNFKSDLLQRNEVNKYEKIVTFASNKIPDQYRTNLAKDFYEASKNNENTFFILRIHPSENKDFYYNLISKKTYNFIIIHSNEMTIADNLAISDLILIHNSNVGNDAIAYKKPLLVLNTIDYPIGIGEELIDFGFPDVKTSAELTEYIYQFRVNSKTQERLKRITERYFAYIYDSVGKEAETKLIKAFIES